MPRDALAGLQRDEEVAPLLAQEGRPPADVEGAHHLRNLVGNDPDFPAELYALDPGQGARFAQQQQQLFDLEDGEVEYDADYPPHQYAVAPQAPEGQWEQFNDSHYNPAYDFRPLARPLEVNAGRAGGLPRAMQDFIIRRNQPRGGARYPPGHYRER